MSARSDEDQFLEICRKLDASRATSLTRLIAVSKADRRKLLRFGNWSDLSFAGEDLSGIDFTGSRLIATDFGKAQIRDTRLTQIVVGHVGIQSSNPTFFDTIDWRAHCERWLHSRHVCGNYDGHLRDLDVFRDTLLTPEMVVIPAQVTRAIHTNEGRVTRRPLSFRLAVAIRPLSLSELAWFRPAVFPPSVETALVSWQEASEYLDWVCDLTGKPYRLLSEGEWELAMTLRLNEHEVLEDGLGRDGRRLAYHEFVADDWRDEFAGEFLSAKAWETDRETEKALRTVRIKFGGGPLRGGRKSFIASDMDGGAALRIARVLDNSPS